MEMKQRIYLDADKEMAVPAGDSRAAFLLCAVGQTIPDVVAKQYGLVGGKIKDVPEKVPPSKVEAKESEVKKEDPPENKAVKNTENKGKGKGE